MLWISFLRYGEGGVSQRRNGLLSDIRLQWCRWSRSRYLEGVKFAGQLFHACVCSLRMCFASSFYPSQVISQRRHVSIEAICHRQHVFFEGFVHFLKVPIGDWLIFVAGEEFLTLFCHVILYRKALKGLADSQGSVLGIGPRKFGRDQREVAKSCVEAVPGSRNPNRTKIDSLYFRMSS